MNAVISKATLAVLLISCAMGLTPTRADDESTTSPLVRDVDIGGKGPFCMVPNSFWGDRHILASPDGRYGLYTVVEGDENAPRELFICDLPAQRFPKKISENGRYFGALWSFASKDFIIHNCPGSGECYPYSYQIVEKASGDFDLIETKCLGADWTKLPLPSTPDKYWRGKLYAEDWSRDGEEVLIHYACQRSSGPGQPDDRGYVVCNVRTGEINSNFRQFKSGRPDINTVSPGASAAVNALLGKERKKLAGGASPVLLAWAKDEKAVVVGLSVESKERGSDSFFVRCDSGKTIAQVTDQIPPGFITYCNYLPFRVRAQKPVAPILKREGVEVRFDEETRTFEIADADAGKILEHGRLSLTRGTETESTADRSLRYRTTLDPAKGTMTLDFPGMAVISARISEGPKVEIATQNLADEYLVEWMATASAAHPLVAMVEAERPNDRGVLVTRLGEAKVSRARSLFDPDRDLAATLDPIAEARWTKDTEKWAARSRISGSGTVLSLNIQRHYYRDTLKIAQYAPITKRARWQTAPIVAMTWYGIEGWKGTPAQMKEWLYPNIDWVAKYLLPYAETLVFQLDDNYYTDNDKYMRDISDYIRSKNLIPGIWFTPYTVAPPEVAAKHPDWFLHDKDGKPIKTFGGVSYRDHFTLNATNPDAVKNWFGTWWRKASETWNYDFFKIDGEPQVIDAYTSKAVDGGGLEGYRKGLAIAREIVGPAKFINGCWGIPLGAIGPLDGSRTGPDTGNQAHAIDIVLRWNFLNNICWWSDPDAAANLYKATVERARLNAQARVLTGQQFLTDDVWTSVPEAIRRVWQLSYPMLDIKPVNLYKIDDWRKYDIFDLRIAKPWGTCDVVGLFNYDGRPVVKTFDLARLPLDADEVHVYEYWKGIYLGKFRRDARIERFLEANEGELFRITAVSKEGGPVLISTSRHASQGGLDLDDLKWSMGSVNAIGRVGGKAPSVSGKSSHLVQGDPYEIVFASAGFEPRRIRGGEKATGGTGSALTADSKDIHFGGGVSRARIMPKANGTEEWDVFFFPISGPRLDVAPAICDLAGEMKAELQLISQGSEKVEWRAEASDPRIKLSQKTGSLGRSPAESTVGITVDPSELEPGSLWTGKVKFTTNDPNKYEAAVEVRFHVPPPENLARRAKAKASSVWGRGHEANKVNDGDTATRWNAGKQEKQGGCWIELDWGKPVAFNRVVIDEVMEFNGRIEAWKLEAGDEKLEELARGANMGLRRTIDLKKPVEARRLRLTIEKAIETPTIRELEVYEMSGGR